MIHFSEEAIVLLVRKIKAWWRGKPPSFKEIVDATRPRYLETPPETEVSGLYHRPLLARAVNAIGRFSTQHWKWLIPLVISTILGIAALYLKYLLCLSQRVGPR